MSEDWETTGEGELDAGSLRRWVLGIVVVVEMNITDGVRVLVAECGEGIGEDWVGIA